jgi:hypothetical protein
MSDYGNAVAALITNTAYIAGGTATTVNANITTGSTAATLASIPATLTKYGTYSITGTGIPANTTFQHQGTTAIVLSKAATATNATAATTIVPAPPKVP